MKLVSVNVGLPREIAWHGKHARTSIYKQPATGRIALRALNLDGDRQADLSVHGGPHKAVYCYPIEHYSYWNEELPGQELPIGVFGENFTTQGLDENEVHVGDEFSIGSATIVVTQPRLPCYKLAARFQSDDMVRRFLASGRTGAMTLIPPTAWVAPVLSPSSWIAIRVSLTSRSRSTMPRSAASS